MALTQLSPELDGSRLLEPKLNAPYNNLYGPRRIALDQDNRIHGTRRIALDQNIQQH